MKTDDPVILRRLQEIEQACAGLRMACGLPEQHAITSRQEGRATITIGAARTLIAREWDNYPDKLILELELVDRGLSEQQAVTLIQTETQRRTTT